jgi:hypothetical protein
MSRVCRLIFWFPNLSARRAPPAKGYFLHRQHARVELDGAVDVPDGENQVIDANGASTVSATASRSWNHGAALPRSWSIGSSRETPPRWTMSRRRSPVGDIDAS